MSKENYYASFCTFVALLLFLYGFFIFNYDFDRTYTRNFTIPLKDGKIGRAAAAKSHGVVDKIVIMVIDAIRYDYFFNNGTSQHMPFVYSSIRNNRSCVFPCRVHLPTVTMPRIKAITTGTVPSFLDVALNFGSSVLLQDNILEQISKAGKNIVFYGDETWMKLFPDLFYRAEGTTSFFVTDFVEVDSNVTRNVEKEIRRDDWDVMILHYLGLDHIGHLEGPFSPKMPSKLREMDSIVEKLINYLTKVKMKTNENYLMILCGDHGMRDGGGHGGSTIPEIMVPLVSFGVDCAANEEISQVDIAVTLSALLNLPIPRDNVGKIIVGLLKSFPVPEQLEMLHRNVGQLIKKYTNSLDRTSLPRIQKSFDEAFELHKNGNFNKALEAYRSILNHLSSTLIYSLTKFDSFCLYVAIVLAVQASCLPVMKFDLQFGIIKTTILTTLFVICTIYGTCYYFHFDSLLCALPSSSFFISTLTAFLLSFNTVLIIRSWRAPMRTLKPFLISLTSDYVLSYLVFGSILQICSAVSTSFIEEEHMIWYFFWSTLLTSMLRKRYSRKDGLIILFMLLVHRIICKLNQTGDKWASLPDIKDWFKVPDRIGCLSAFTVLELSCTFLVLQYFYKNGEYETKSLRYKASIFSLYLDAFCLGMVYVYRSAVQEVVILDYVAKLLSSRGVFEFRIYLYALMLSAFLKSVRIPFRENSRKIFSEFLKVLICVWMVFSSLLLRSYNIILVGSLSLVSNLLMKLLKKESNRIIKLVIAHHWLAHVYFFYQGNSSSLASIDIAPGYIGQENYNQFIAGVLIVTCVYAMPILAYLFMLWHFVNDDAKTNAKKSLVWSSVSTLLLLANSHITFYLIIVTIQRYHLFIWSVFSPKLLYLSVYSILLYFIIVILQLFEPRNK